MKSAVLPDGQPAMTVFSPLSRGGGFTLARVVTKTGRKHQIRVHAHWLGFPVVGDKIYGPDSRLFLDFIDGGWTPALAARLLLSRQALHCAEIDLRPAGLPHASSRRRFPRICAIFAPATDWRPLGREPLTVRNEGHVVRPMSQVRVRFAPSPTGFFHIGSARTALFNWLYARHTGGVFVLRIEDTDKARNSDEFLNLIYDSLNWLGLGWDEGPGVGGPYGPYLQSERSGIYREHLEKLRAGGRTYEKDGAVYFKLEGERSEVFDEHRKKTVVKVKNAPAIIEDRIRGRVERTEDEDFVIFRSDGNPVFHFVNVVDDMTMGITHVIRGEDHLSNTSKHIELFKAFGAPVPVYAHIPLILKQSGPGKMSKRDKGALGRGIPRPRGTCPRRWSISSAFSAGIRATTGRKCRSRRLCACSTCPGSTRATRASTTRSSRT